MAIVMGSYKIELGYIHCKYCVLDSHVVIPGFYNWTCDTESYNNEDLRVLML